jgi:hypothetical protein
MDEPVLERSRKSLMRTNEGFSNLMAEKHALSVDKE